MRHSQNIHPPATRHTLSRIPLDRRKTPGQHHRFSAPRLALVAAALGTLYIVWGSTYLGIRIAIHTIPPLLMASIRFAIAGVLLYAWSVRRGDTAGDRPGRRQWIATAIVGVLLLAGGNGGVS